MCSGRSYAGSWERLEYVARATEHLHEACRPGEAAWDDRMKSLGMKIVQVCTRRRPRPSHHPG